MRREDIEAVFAYCSTDKLAHGYAMVYEKVPIHIRRVFEIGVSSGHSLLAWRDLFPLATIYGLDVSACSPLGERIVVLRGDIKEFSPSEERYDLIVDDGSHQLEDILAGWKVMRERCDGLYVVEDVSQDIAGRLFTEMLLNVPMVSVIPTGRGGDDRCIIAQFDKVVQW